MLTYALKSILPPMTPALKAALCPSSNQSARLAVSCWSVCCKPEKNLFCLRCTTTMVSYFVQLIHDTLKGWAGLGNMSGFLISQDVPDVKGMGIKSCTGEAVPLLVIRHMYIARCRRVQCFDAAGARAKENIKVKSIAGLCCVLFWFRFLQLGRACRHQSKAVRVRM